MPMAPRKRKSEVTGFRREKGLFVRQLDKKRQKTRLRSVFPIWVGKERVNFTNSCFVDFRLGWVKVPGQVPIIR